MYPHNSPTHIPKSSCTSLHASHATEEEQEQVQNDLCIHIAATCKHASMRKGASSCSYVTSERCECTYDMCLVPCKAQSSLPP